MPRTRGGEGSSTCQGPVFQPETFRLGPPNLRGLDLLLKPGPSTGLPQSS